VAEKVELEIGVKDDASKKIDQITGKVEDATKKPYDIDLRLKPDESIESALQRVTSQVKETASKVQALGQDTITFRINADQLDTVEKKLEGIQSEVKQVDAETIDITIKTDDVDKLNQNLDNSKTKTEELGKSADSSRSALANMVGNSAQDLGQLGGVAGSAGVAIGQIAEYAADASLAGEGLGSVLASFGTVVLPIAGLAALSALLPVIIGHFTELSTEQKVAKQTTEDLTKAFHDLDSASSDLRFNAIADDLKDLINKTPQLTGHLNDLGVSAADVATEMVGGTSPAISRVRDDYKSLTDTLATVTTAQMNSAEARASGNDAAVAASQAEQLVADSLGITTQELRDRVKVEKETLDAIDGKVEGTKKAIETDDAARQALEKLNQEKADAKAKDEAAKKAAEDFAKAQENEKKAVDDLRSSMEHLNATWDEGTQAADSFSSVFAAQESGFFALHQSAADVEDGFSKLGKTVHDAGQDFLETGGHLTSLSEDGRNVLDALEPLGKAIGENLSAELANAGGNFDSVRTKAAGYREELIAQMTQAGLSQDSIEGYIEQLNLTPEQVETTIVLAKQDEARKKIADLHVDISNIPVEARTEFLADTNKGDYEAAYAVLSGILTNDGKGVTADTHVNTATGSGELTTWRLDESGKPVKVPVHADTSPAESSAAAFRRKEEADAIDIPIRTTRGQAQAVMSGGPINQTGVYTVGEAGRETVVLPGGSQVLTAGRTMQLAAGQQQPVIHIINVNVKVDPLVPLAQAGREVANALDAYYRTTGSRPRAVA
jgi:uncharacterized protein YukE